MYTHLIIQISKNNNNNFIRTIPSKDLITTPLSPKESQIYKLAINVQKLEVKFTYMAVCMLLLQVKPKTKNHISQLRRYHKATFLAKR